MNILCFIHHYFYFYWKSYWKRRISANPYKIQLSTRRDLQMRWIDELSRRNSLRGYENVQTSTRKTLPLDEMLAPSSTPRTINNLSMETGPLPRIKQLREQEEERLRTRGEQTPPSNGHGSSSSIERIKKIFMFFEPKGCLQERDNYSLYLFPPNNR